MITPEQAGILLDADLRNIVKKVKDGKTLTSSERKTLEAASGKAKNNDPAIAKRWGVTVQSVVKWRAKGYPVEDDFELAKAIRDNPKAGSAAIKYAKKLLALMDRNENDQVSQTESQETTSATAETDQTHATKASEGGADDLERTIKILQQRLALYNQQIDGHKDLTVAEVKMWAGLVNDTAKAVVANRLAQKKLGLEIGETVQRSECESIAWALVSRLCVGVQRMIQVTAPQLVGASDPSAVARVLEPASITELILAPMRASVTTQTGVSLPSWFVAAVEKALGDFVEEENNNNETN